MVAKAGMWPETGDGVNAWSHLWDTWLQRRKVTKVDGKLYIRTM